MNDEVYQQERPYSKQKYLFHYMVGFIEGEGCFSVSIKAFNQMKFGWVVDPMFSVYQHKNNRPILEMIKNQFHCGYIVEKQGTPEVLVFVVDNRRSLEEQVIPFFLKYPLLGTKAKDFKLFSEIVSRMGKKDHLKKKGLIEIVKLAYQMNQNGKSRKYQLDDVLHSIMESSETTR